MIMKTSSSVNAPPDATEFFSLMAACCASAPPFEQSILIEKFRGVDAHFAETAGDTIYTGRRKYRRWRPAQFHSESNYHPKPQHKGPQVPERPRRWPRASDA